jgi:hypothetical protein
MFVLQIAVCLLTRAHLKIQLDTFLIKRSTTMHPVLKLLSLDTPYRSSMQATTELHAGGVFFCVLYTEVLEFRSDGTVRRWCEVTNGARALDNEDEELRRINESGSYLVNDRGYLELSFADRKMTGLPWLESPELLAFHVWHPSNGLTYGRVYHKNQASSKA